MSRGVPCLTASVPQALEFLEQQVVAGSEVLDVKDEAEVARRLRVRLPCRPDRLAILPKTHHARALHRAPSAASSTGMRTSSPSWWPRRASTFAPRTPRTSTWTTSASARRVPLLWACCRPYLTPCVTRVLSLQITGGGLHDSLVVQGLVIKRDAEGTVKRVTDAKVSPFVCAWLARRAHADAPRAPRSPCLAARWTPAARRPRPRC